MNLNHGTTQKILVYSRVSFNLCVFGPAFLPLLITIFTVDVYLLVIHRCLGLLVLLLGGSK